MGKDTGVGTCTNTALCFGAARSLLTSTQAQFCADPWNSRFPIMKASSDLARPLLSDTLPFPYMHNHDNSCLFHSGLEHHFLHFRERRFYPKDVLILREGILCFRLVSFEMTVAPLARCIDHPLLVFICDICPGQDVLLEFS